MCLRNHTRADTEQKCADIYWHLQGYHSKCEAFTSGLKYKTFLPQGVFHDMYPVLMLMEEWLLNNELEEMGKEVAMA